MKLSYRNSGILGGVLTLLAFVVYLRTLSPTVGFIDSGELAAVAATLGIAHPTGYPLFTLMGWMFAQLPFGFSTIYKLNLMSAVLCSLAVFFYYRLFLFLFSEEVAASFQSGVGRSRRETKAGDAGSHASKRRAGLPIQDREIAAATGALIFAFSETYWSQALSIEVYSLHILFLALTILFFTGAIHEYVQDRESRKSLVWWYAFALTLGLSFTNHMTTILVAPAFLYLYFTTHGFSRSSWMKIVKGAVPFLVGFSVYLYLPLRAVQGPLLNWGDPQTLDKFWWHFTGKQYRVWIFSSVDSAAQQFQYFFESLPSEFTLLPLCLAALGLFSIFRRLRKLFVYTLVLFVGCVLYSINYDIHDIDSYFLLAYVATAIWIAFGFLTIIQKIKNRYMKIALGLVLIAMPLYTHFDNVDQSRNFVVEDYTKNMFSSLDSNAIVLSYQWDYFVSASYYYQLVEEIRSDVVVLDKELFRRSWYFSQLERQYPWLIEQSRPEVNAFLHELRKFEHDLPYNPAVIQGRFEALIISFLEKNYDTRPVYVTHEIEPEFTRGFQRIPTGVAYRLSRLSSPGAEQGDSVVQRVKLIDLSIREFPKSNKYVEMVRTMYATLYTNQAIYTGLAGDRDAAIVLLKNALAIRPNFGTAVNWLNRFQSKP